MLVVLLELCEDVVKFIVREIGKFENDMFNYFGVVLCVLGDFYGEFVVYMGMLCVC